MKRINFLSASVLAIILLLFLSAVPVSADFKADYYDYDEMVTVLEYLEDQSSSEATDVYSLSVIGNSYQDNPIYAVKFSDDPGTEDDSEPDVLIDGGIHSNEWMGTESTVRAMASPSPSVTTSDTATNLPCVAACRVAGNSTFRAEGMPSTVYSNCRLGRCCRNSCHAPCK